MHLDMHELLDAVTALALQVSPEKVQAIAARIRQTDSSQLSVALSDVVRTPGARVAIGQLISAWGATQVSAGELSVMLLSASHAVAKAASEQSIELVWTGPTTPFVSARRTEQALLQVINSADKALFITSFVAYDVATIVKALNAASNRGVEISMLLETSKDDGGRITFDAISKMKRLVPAAHVYSWRDRATEYSAGSVHAKIAVADAHTCFITSANLTGYAMEKNMEAGVLIQGGDVPRALSDHLQYLVQIRTVHLHN